MKTSIKNFKSCLLQFFALLIIWVWSGCTGFSASELSGTYINSAGSEFSVADDTLRVEKGEGNHFLIHRSTGFNLLDESGIRKRQYEREEWIAVYDTETDVMTEQRSGKLITFSPGGKEMLVGKRRYTRIN